MSGPYPIYGSEDENWQPEPPQGNLTEEFPCSVCLGDGGWYEDSEGHASDDEEYLGDEVWVKCESCGGAGWL